MRGVKTTIGTWQGHLYLSVALIDDYKIILDMEFLDKVKAIPISFANTLLIVDEDKTCMVLMDRPTKKTIRVLSAIWFRERYLGNKFTKEQSEQLKKNHNKPHKASRRNKKANKELNKPAKNPTFWGPRHDEDIASLGVGGCHIALYFP